MKGNLIIAFLVLFFVFVPMERLFALRKDQPIFRKSWFNDVIHFFFNHFLVKAGFAISAFTVAVLLKSAISPKFQAAVAAQPGWLQFIEALLLGEFAHYIAHRMMHEVPALWRLHSIHHSIEEMDWLASARLHPLDQIITKTITIIPLYVMGFTKETFGVYLVLTAFQALFVHANVRFKFGWLRWLIATPEFHHWHHAAEREAYDKNFAGQLPLMDWLFGTLHLPAGRMPAAYGIKDPVPAGYLKQLAYPFRKQQNL